jgi:hypothetical protein
MKYRIGFVVIALLCAAAWPAAAQQSTAPAAAASNAVPNLINYSGLLKDSTGRTLTTLTGVTFLLYSDEQGGAPLWLETQNVTPDKTGHYTVLLGSTTSTGLSSDLFVSGAARWLAVQIAGQSEQPRVLLVAVPYAMKAVDAQTVGGLPPSAFVLAAPPTTTEAAAATSGSTASAAAAVSPAASSSSDVTTTGGTANTIPMFTTATNIQNSILTQTSTTAINVKGKLNLPATGTATASAGYNSQAQDFVASVYNSSTSTAVPQTFQWQAEPLNNDKSTATGTLNLLYASGTATPAETGLKLSSKGLFTFASGQTFPGTGTITGITTATGSGLAGGGTSGTLSLSLLKTCTANQMLTWNGTAWACSTPTLGTVTSVASGAGLTGGPITSSGTLSIASAGVTNAMLQNSSLTVSPGTALTGGGAVSLGGSTTLNVDTTKVPLLAAANTFTGNQTVNGNLSATGIVSGSAYQIGSNLFAFGSVANGNAFLGFAGNSSTNANSDTATGYQALGANTTGSNNTADGAGALYSNTTGNFNTASGWSALDADTTGSYNTASGFNAGYPTDNTKVTGGQNTFLGAQTFPSTGSLSNATAVGANAEVGESNALVLGSINGVNGATASVNVGIGTTTPGAPLEIDGANQKDFWIKAPETGAGAGMDLFTTGTGGMQWEVLNTGAGSSQGANKLNFRNVTSATDIVTITGAGPVGIGTTSPAYTLDVQGSGRFTQPVTFASSQTFPGAGTITGVTAGTGLSGGGTSGSVTLGINTSVVPQLNTANTFTNNLTVNANVTAATLNATNATIDSLSVPDTGLDRPLQVTSSSSNAVAIDGTVTTSQSDNVIGVYGRASNSSMGIGVFGQQGSESSTGTKLLTNQPVFAGGVGVWGDGGTTSSEIGVVGTVDNGWAGYFENNSSDGDITLGAQADNGSSEPFYAGNTANETYCDVDASGNLNCSGSKNAVVPVDGGKRIVAMSAIESPKNWFEDFGSAQLVNGAAVVALDPTFIQTVNSEMDYKVFPVPNGDCKGLYVTNKTATSFEVRELGGGTSSVSFDYRITALRKNYENVRFADHTHDLDSIKAMHERMKNAHPVSHDPTKQLMPTPARAATLKPAVVAKPK